MSKDATHTEEPKTMGKIELNRQFSCLSSCSSLETTPPAAIFGTYHSPEPLLPPGTRQAFGEWGLSSSELHSRSDMTTFRDRKGHLLLANTSSRLLICLNSQNCNTCPNQSQAV